jgi:hypothetical protein
MIVRFLPRALGAPAIGLVLAGLLLPPSGPPAIAGEMTVKEAMRFAADMAVGGSWREALYRWERATAIDPTNPKLLNNLAVAQEVLGKPEEAREYYELASRESGGDPQIEDNRRRFAHFWRDLLEPEDDDGDLDIDMAALGGSSGKTKGRTTRVAVDLPVPPRLTLEGFETLLVTSFLHEEINLLDTNRELVRFLRSEFHKYTDLDVLDINPPPAIPEQQVEELLANIEFWKHLGRTYEADLIVSGVVKYDREDISSFQNVDYISERTGQKVRETRFVEQEQFIYHLDIFFIDGATGELLFRDRMQRAVIFQGSQNDPITAFYSISETIADDVLSVVTLRTRQDTRIIFKK